MTKKTVQAKSSRSNKKNPQRGGIRDGAGRPAMFGENQIKVLITVPKELKEQVQEYVRKLKIKYLKTIK
jgi:hypothetical protein